MIPEDILQEELEGFFAQFNPVYDHLAHIFYIKIGFVRAYRISEQGEELTIAILKPYDIHNEFSRHISALERFKENRIKNVFVTDTKEKKWYASTKDIQRIVKELQEIDISNTHPQSHQTAHYD